MYESMYEYIRVLGYTNIPDANLIEINLIYQIIITIKFT